MSAWDRPVWVEHAGPHDHTGSHIRPSEVLAALDDEQRQALAIVIADANECIYDGGDTEFVRCHPVHCQCAVLVDAICGTPASSEKQASDA